MVAVCLLDGSASVGQSEGARRFQNIASQLDPGGDLFLILNPGRWMDAMLEALAAGESGLPVEAADEQDARTQMEALNRFLNRQGMGSLQGVGISSVPSAGGRYAFKLFLQRETVDANLPFWRGLFGWQPRRLMSLDFLPADVGIARAATLEPATLWGIMTRGMETVADVETQIRFAAFRASLTAWLGVDPDVFFESLRDEILVAVRFEAMADLPGVVGELSPSFLIVVGTGEHVLRGVVEAKLSRKGVRLMERVVAGDRMRYAETPMPGAALLQPAFASPQGFFLFGSDPSIVEAALLANRHRNGLVARPDFQTAFQGQSMVNNGIFYISEDAAAIMKLWRHARFEGVTGQERRPGTERLLYALFTGGEALPACALVTQNRRRGVMLMGRSGIGGQALLARAGLRPLQALLQFVEKLDALSFPGRAPPPSDVAVQTAE